ncbi:hypothetical protein [Janthinobacterium sp. LB3P118]|uniref:hypothetical protein n=1 Tax=Janthinobacterium sp. LB3P118 TaxID=3424195 RepID=UPI003F1EA9FC
MAHLILVTITTASVVSGFMSAAAWLYASTVKISREEAVDQRKKEALRKGETPNLGSVSLDGWDMSATFSAQSKWNSCGAALAACAVGLQALGQALGSA